MANKNDSKSAPTQEQLDITNAMAKAMQAMLGDAKRLEASFISQATAIKQMCEAMECLRSPDTVNNLREIKNNLDQIAKSAEGLRGVGSALSDVSSDAESATSSTEKLRDALNDTRKGSDKLGTTTSKLAKLFRSGLGKAATFAAGGAKALANGFKFLFNVGRAGFGVLGTLVKGVFSIGRALLAIPLTIFRKLTEMANKGATGISEWAQALNELKKEFGFLSDPTNSAILASARNVDKVYGKQAAFKLFGTPAERVKELAEIMKSAGPNLVSFSNDIAAGNVELLGFSRGLGITGTDFEAFALRARTSGQELGDTLTNVAKYSLAMSRKFNLNMKDISRAMGKAAQDMTHFGNISEKQIGVAVTYAQKLGIQLDKITGSFDKFSTFDDAAENISKINEAFGTNLDVGEIMMEQDPAAQFEMIRKGLMGAGIQGEKMTFAQRKLLESTTGWDSATQIAALSTKNAGIALKDFQKEADKSEKVMMTQTEALKKLTGAMHENLKAGNPPPGKGFFDKFLEGMKFALETHPAFMRLMQAFRKGFIDARQSGISFGTFLINNIPGIVKMMDGLAEIVGKIGVLFNGVSGAVKKFVTNTNKNMGQFLQDVSKNPKAAFEQLGGDLQKVFSDFFNVQAPGGRKLIEGFKDFMRFLIAIISGALPYIMDTMANIISKIADFITNPSKFMAAAKQKAMSGAGAGGGMLAPLIVAVTAAWPNLENALDKLGKAIFEKLEKLFVEYQPKIEKFFSDLFDKVIKKLKDEFKNADFGTLFSVFSTAVGAGGGISLFIGGLKTIGPVIQAMKIAQLTKDVANLTQVLSGAAPQAVSAATEVAGFGAKMSGLWTTITAGVATAGTAIKGFFVTTIPAALTAAWTAFSAFIVKAAAALGPAAPFMIAIAAVGAAISQVIQLMKDLEQLEQDRKGAAKEIAEAAKSHGTEGLRNLLGVDAQGKVLLDQTGEKGMTEEQLKAAYERYLGKPVIFDAEAKQKIINYLEASYTENLKMAKEADEDAQAKMKGQITAAQRKKKEEMDKKAAEARAQQDYESLMKQLGYGGGTEININTFKQKIEEIDKIAKTVSAGAEGLQKNFDVIREKLGGVKFNLFGEDAAKSAAKVEEMESALKALQNFHGFIVVIGRVVQDSQDVGKQLDTFGKVEDANSIAGKIKQIAQNQTDTINAVVKAFTGSDIKDVSKEASTRMRESISEVKQLIAESSATFSILANASENIKKLASDDIKISKEMSDKIDANIKSLGTPISDLLASVQTTFTGIGISFDLGPLEKDITGIKDNIEKIKNSYNAMGPAASGLDAMVPPALQALGTTINDFPNAVGNIVMVNIGSAAKAVEDFITEARKLSAALDAGGTIDLDASLKKFGETAFVAKGGKYTVTSKEVVINVNFKIAMDAEEIQGAMAKRGVFKEKINEILSVLPDVSKEGENARRLVASRPL